MSTEKDASMTVVEERGAPETTAVDIGKLMEDRMTWREVFSWRVSLSVLFLIISYMSAVGALVFLSILLLPYQQTLGPSTVANWIPISHITVATCIFTLSGRWSDLLGRRWFFIVADVIAAAGCFVGATAQSINALIACGVVTGFATGTQQIAAAAIQEPFPNSYKPIAMGIFGVGTLPIQFAPLVASSFISSYSITWRGCWWIVFSLNITAAIGLAVVYYPPNRADLHQSEGALTLKQEIINFDWLGYLFLVAAIVLFLIGLNWGGNQYPWKSAAVIVSIVLGVVFLAVFVVWEMYTKAKVPLIDKRLMAYKKSFIMPTVCIAASAMGYYSLNILYPQMIAVFFTTDTWEQGYYQMAIPAGLILGGFSYGPCSKLIKHYKYQTIACAVLQMTFTAALAAADVGRQVMTVAFIFIAAFCLSWMTLNAQLIMTISLPPRFLGAAFGLAGAFRLALGTVATTIYVVVLTNELKRDIPGQVIPAAAKAGLPASSLPDLFKALTAGTAQAFGKVPGITEAIIAAVVAADKRAYHLAFKKVFLVSIAFSALGALCSLFLKNVTTENTNNHVTVSKNAHDRGDHAHDSPVAASEGVDETHGTDKRVEDISV